MKFDFNEFLQLLNYNPGLRVALKIGVFILGFLLSWFGIFQLFFLAHVLPHGGI